MKHLFEDPANTQSAIKLLQSGDDALYEKVYHLYRNQFINWGVKNWKLRKEDLEDVFQDAMIILFKKVHLVESNSTIKAYLQGIYLNKVRHKYRDQIKWKTEENFDDISLGKFDDTIYQKANDEHLKQMLLDGMQKIGEPCWSILKLRYYNNFNGKSIADRLGYKNADVVYTKTNNCLKQLRKLVAQKF